MFNFKNINKFNTFLSTTVIATPILAHYIYIFPYIYLKNIAFRSIVLIAILFALLSLLSQVKLEFKRNYILLAFGIFVLVQAVASIFGVNFLNSLFGNYERMDGLVHYLFLLAYFILLVSHFKKTVNWLVIFRVSLFSALWIILYDFFGRWGWIAQTPIAPNAGTIGNTLFFGSYLMFNIFFASLAFYIDKQKNWRSFYIVSFVALLGMLFVNASRSSILGLLVGVFVAMIWWWFKANTKIKIALASLFIISCAFVGLVFVQRQQTWVQNTLFLKRFVDIAQGDSSTQNRLLIWQVAIKSFQEKPILGYGPENAVYGLNKNYNPQISEQWFDRVHNFVLDNLLASGIFGLLSFLSIFFLAFKKIFTYAKEHYALSAILSSTLVAYLVSNLFTFDSLVTWLPLVLLLAFISFLGSQDYKTCVFERPRFVFKQTIYLQALLWVVFIFGFYFLIIKPTQANTIGFNAANYSFVQPEKSLNFYQQAFAYNTFGKKELSFALLDSTKNIIASVEIDLTIKQSFVDETEKQILAILSKDAEDIRLRMSLADVYLDFAEIDPSYNQRAIDLLAPSAEVFVNRLEIQSILARAYLQENNLLEASNYLAKSLDIYDGRQQDHLVFLSILHQLHDKERFEKYAAQYLMKFEDISTANYNKIFKYYFNLTLVPQLLDLGIVQKLMLTTTDLNLQMTFVDLYSILPDKQPIIEYITNMQTTDAKRAADLDRYFKIVKED